MSVHLNGWRRTREFWGKVAEAEAFTSDVVFDEIERTPDESRRSLMQTLLADTVRIPVTPEMRELASRYIEHGLFGPVMYNDALHIAGNSSLFWIILPKGEKFFCIGIYQ